MEMRRCKDVVFGYSVCDVSMQLSRRYELHLAAEAHAKPPTIVTLSCSPYPPKIVIVTMHNTLNMIHIDMSFCAYCFENTAFLPVDFTGVNDQCCFSLPASVQR